MVIYYTTLPKLAGFLGLTDGAGNRLTFSTETIPTSAEVTIWINEVEDTIDLRLNHAWRATSISTEYYDYDGSGLLWLVHSPVQGPFESGTDLIECWNGSTWYDLVANKTEGRGSDYWVDYTDGVIYFLTYAPLIGKRTIRVTYVHGETAVPKWLEHLTNIMVGMIFYMNDDYSQNFPAGTDNVPLATKMERWQKEIDETYKQKEHLAFK